MKGFLQLMFSSKNSVENQKRRNDGFTDERIKQMSKSISEQTTKSIRKDIKARKDLIAIKKQTIKEFDEFLLRLEEIEKKGGN